MKFLLFGASAMAMSMALTPTEQAESKYVVVTEFKLYAEALAYCENEVSVERGEKYTLAMPKNPELNAEIYAAMKAVIDDKNSMWIGIHDYHVEGVWRFADNTLMNDYAVNFPDGVFPWSRSGGDNNANEDVTGEDCVGIYSGVNGDPVISWNDMPCASGASNQQRLHFICGPRNDGVTIPTPTLPGKVYWSPDVDKALWQGAAKICSDEVSGAKLAMPKSHEESVAMMAHSVVGDKEEPFWIGITDTITEGEWLYVDGTPLLSTGYRGWYVYQGVVQPDNNLNEYLPPGDITGEDCAGIFTRNDGSNEIAWNDMPCMNHTRPNEHYFICEGSQLPAYLTTPSVSANASTTLPYIAAVVSCIITVAVILRSYLKKAQKTAEYTPITQEYGAVSV